jgi:methionyl-tRNA formyltransferase
MSITPTTTNNLRIIYAGTPDFAVPALRALIDSQHDVVAVYTQPDRPAGRGRKITFSPVKQQAIEARIPVEQPEHLKTAAVQETLRAYQADVMVVAAYGLLLPQVVLDIPTYGCLNIHGSLLPRWRGAAPIQRAIAAGDKETGITIMQMDKGLDTGDMLHKSAVSITHTATGQSIHDALAIQGANDIVTVINKINKIDGDRLHGEVQDEQYATYAHKLTKEEANIDWNDTARNIDYNVRAFSPWPIAYTYYHGKPMKIHSTSVKKTDTATLEQPVGTVINESKEGIEVSTGQGILLIHRLQMPGKRAMDTVSFLNGRSLESAIFQSN